MLIVYAVRIAITATFLILAAGGPYAIILLRRFIVRYEVAHTVLEMAHNALKVEHEALKKRVEALESQKL